MPATATEKIRPHFVSQGPPQTSGGASDWCVLEIMEPQHIAPGGVVLCVRGTTMLHPNARRYAREAWATYGHYLAAITPSLAKNWTPDPVVIPGRVVAWERTNRVWNAQYFTPGEWVLMNRNSLAFSGRHVQAAYYAELEWARFAKTHKGTGVDNLRARGSYSISHENWLPPAPILKDADVRNANKYNRRAVTTPKQRAEGLARIKRPVAVVAS